MKFNKQIAIILVLFSLLLSALGLSYYFYTQNKISINNSNKLIVVYVASKTIPKHTKITMNDIKQYKTSRKFVLNKPILKKDILGKYAKTTIYKNDTISKSKLLIKILKNIKKKNILNEFKYNSYNIAFKMFRNPNLSLKQGDIINIISVYPATKAKVNGSTNAVQYVAKEIKILGFLIDGEESNQISKKVKRTRIVKKKQITQTVVVKAKELILDINSDILLSLTDDYNRGKQLWMVKTRITKKSKKITKPNFTNVSKKKVTKIIKKKYYPYKTYKAKKVFKKIQATIHYADQKDAIVTKKHTIQINKKDACKIKDKILVTVSRSTNLRQLPTLHSKIKRVIYRNTFIAYDKKINTNWYRTCDGYFIHKNEASKVSNKYMIKKLTKQ